MAAFEGAHHHRLHHALLLDGLGQLLQRLFVHVPARLIAPALDQVQGQLLQLGFNGRIRRSIILQVGPGTLKKGVEASLAQSAFAR